MHIGFVHTRALNAEGVGSTHSASRLALELADAGHQVTVYCPTIQKEQVENSESGPYSGIDIVELQKKSSSVIPDRLFEATGKALYKRRSELERHDIVHSYVSSISWLAKIRHKISTPIITSLNGYGPVCPKKNLFYKESEPCRENSFDRCLGCIINSTTYPEKSDRFDGASVYDEYGGFKRLPANVYLLTKRFRALRTMTDIKDSTDGIDAYHVQADHLTDIFGEFGFPRSRFYTVPNILDEDFLVARQSDFSEPYRLLYVGSLIKKKGVQKLPPMLELLRDEYDADYELTVVGSGYLQEPLKVAIKERGLNATVAGQVPYQELPEIYANHDMFVYPGIWEEPFARVFLEALASGTPIIGSSVGDLGEIVGEAGVVTDGSPEALAKAVHQIRGDDLSTMSTEAEKRAERYLPSEVVPQLEEMYKKTIAGAE
jgi:glycosyltransferase involved in cell wall biosynthesis